MKITCPACKTNYNIDDSNVPEKGLRVKCSICNTEYKVNKKGKEDHIAQEAPKGMDAQIVNDPLDDLFNDFDDTSKPSDSKDAHSKADSDPLDDLFTDQERAQAEEKTVVDKSVDDLFSDISSNEETVSDNTVSDLINQDSSVGADDVTRNYIADDKNGSSAISPSDDDILIESHRKETEETDLFDDIKMDIEQTSYEAADDDIGSDLFDDLEDNTVDLGTKILNQSIQQSNEEVIYTDNVIEEKENKNIFFKKRRTEEVIGPFGESEVEALLENGTVDPDDYISYDSISWEPLTGSEDETQVFNTEPPQQTGQKTQSFKYNDAGQYDFDQEETKVGPDSGLSMSGDSLFNDDISTFEETAVPDFNETNVKGRSQNVNHTVIPESLKGKAYASSKMDLHKKTSAIPKLLFFLILFGGFGSAAYYWYINKTPETDVLEKISESIAENTGTLLDVRKSLNEDVLTSYIKSIGILKQYTKGEDIPPAVVGLDAQVKLNMIISYNKKIESMNKLSERVKNKYSSNSENIDMAKAMALLYIVEKNYSAAIRTIKPFLQKNNPEVYYILGLCAIKKNDLKNAYKFLNSGFITSEGKSNKIAYQLAMLKKDSGDTDGALAFLNKIISASPYYIRAYLTKSKILIKTKNQPEDSIELLKNISNSALAIASDGEKAEYYALLAQSYYIFGAIKEAIEYYNKTVEIDKNNVEYLTRLADFYREIGNSSQALTFYNKALIIKKDYVPAILGKARVFILLKTENKSFLELAKIKSEDVKDPEQLLMLANIYHDLDERKRAISFYDKIIKIKPSFIEPYFKKTLLLLNNKKIKQVKEMVAKIKQLNRESYIYYLLQAILYHQEAEYEKAEKHFKKALMRNENNDSKVYYYYGQFLKDSQKYKKSTEMFSKAVKLEPMKLKYKQALASSLFKEKRYKEVITILKGLTFENKKHYKTLMIIAQAYHKLENYDKAIEYIDKALNFNTRSSLLYYKKAEILLSKGDLNPAEREVDTAIMLDIKNFDNYMLLARILIEKENFRGAIEKIEEAEKIDNTNQKLFLVKGIVYKNLDNYREALKYFKKIKDNKDLQKQAYMEIGECFLQLNKPKTAKKYFVRAIRNGNTAAYEFLAKINYQEGNLNKAVSYYKKTLQYDKNNAEAVKKLAFINKERKQYLSARTYFRKYLKLVEDDDEEDMIEDEIYFLEKNIPKTRLVRQQKDERKNLPKEELNIEKIKTIYMEARSLRDSNPTKAKILFRKVMQMVPKGHKYYRKSERMLNKLSGE